MYLVSQNSSEVLRRDGFAAVAGVSAVLRHGQCSFFRRHWLRLHLQQQCYRVCWSHSPRVLVCTISTQIRPHSQKKVKTFDFLSFLSAVSPIKQCQAVHCCLLQKSSTGGGVVVWRCRQFFSYYCCRNVIIISNITVALLNL